MRQHAKILYVTTVGSTMNFFNSFIEKLVVEGHQVDIATNYSKMQIPAVYRQLGCRVYNIPTERSPFCTGNFKAIRKLRNIIEKGKYDIVHCHTPVAAACVRIACMKQRRQGTKVFYTAHGFHFYTGAPVKNWIVYYPVEWALSWFTDVLITINKEDYHRAKKRFHAGTVEYIPGVGIDMEKFHAQLDQPDKKKKELGLMPSDIMFLSVGELSSRKNHEAAVRAIYQLQAPHIHYFIAGTGKAKSRLNALVHQLELDGQVHFLDYRKDISELCQAADFFLFPSLQEGLPVALMEAIACKTLVICSRIRGNTDLISDSRFLFEAKDIDAVRQCIECALQLGEEEKKKIVEFNYNNLKKFDIEIVNIRMKKVYSHIGGIL